MLQDDSTRSSTSIYKNKKWARIRNAEVIATDLVYLSVQFRKQLKSMDILRSSPDESRS